MDSIRIGDVEISIPNGVLFSNFDDCLNLNFSNFSGSLRIKKVYANNLNAASDIPKKNNDIYLPSSSETRGSSNLTDPIVSVQSKDYDSSDSKLVFSESMEDVPAPPSSVIDDRRVKSNSSGKNRSVKSRKSAEINRAPVDDIVNVINSEEKHVRGEKETLKMPLAEMSSNDSTKRTLSVNATGVSELQKEVSRKTLINFGDDLCGDRNESSVDMSYSNPTDTDPFSIYSDGFSQDGIVTPVDAKVNSHSEPSRRFDTGGLLTGADSVMLVDDSKFMSSSMSHTRHSGTAISTITDESVLERAFLQSRIPSVENDSYMNLLLGAEFIHIPSAASQSHQGSSTFSNDGFLSYSQDFFNYQPSEPVTPSARAGHSMISYEAGGTKLLMHAGYSIESSKSEVTASPSNSNINTQAYAGMDSSISDNAGEQSLGSAYLPPNVAASNLSDTWELDLGFSTLNESDKPTLSWQRLEYAGSPPARSYGGLVRLKSGNFIANGGWFGVSASLKSNSLSDSKSKGFEANKSNRNTSLDANEVQTPTPEIGTPAAMELLDSSGDTLTTPIRGSNFNRNSETSSVHYPQEYCEFDASMSIWLPPSTDLNSKNKVKMPSARIGHTLILTEAVSKNSGTFNMSMSSSGAINSAMGDRTSNMSDVDSSQGSPLNVLSIANSSKAFLVVFGGLAQNGPNSDSFPKNMKGVKVLKDLWYCPIVYSSISLTSSSKKHRRTAGSSPGSASTAEDTARMQGEYRTREVPGGSPTSSPACVYSSMTPQLGTWRQQEVSTGKEPSSRAFHSSANVSAGVVLFGGWDGERCFDEVYLLSWSIVDRKFSWERKDPSSIDGKGPRARCCAATTTIANRFVVISGGFDPSECEEDSQQEVLKKSSSKSSTEAKTPRAPKTTPKSSSKAPKSSSKATKGKNAQTVPPEIVDIAVDSASPSNSNSHAHTDVIGLNTSFSLDSLNSSTNTDTNSGGLSAVDSVRGVGKPFADVWVLDTVHWVWMRLLGDVSSLSRDLSYSQPLIGDNSQESTASKTVDDGTYPNTKTPTKKKSNVSQTPLVSTPDTNESSKDTAERYATVLARHSHAMSFVNDCSFLMTPAKLKEHKSFRLLNGNMNTSCTCGAADSNLNRHVPIPGLFLYGGVSAAGVPVSDSSLIILPPSLGEFCSFITSDHSTDWKTNRIICTCQNRPNLPSDHPNPADFPGNNKKDLRESPKTTGSPVTSSDSKKKKKNGFSPFSTAQEHDSALPSTPVAENKKKKNNKILETDIAADTPKCEEILLFDKEQDSLDSGIPRHSTSKHDPNSVSNSSIKTSKRLLNVVCSPSTPSTLDVSPGSTMSTPLTKKPKLDVTVPHTSSPLIVAAESVETENVGRMSTSVPNTSEIPKDENEPSSSRISSIKRSSPPTDKHSREQRAPPKSILKRSRASTSPSRRNKMNNTPSGQKIEFHDNAELVFGTQQTFETFTVPTGSKTKEAF